jgi:hypothetical protein
LTGVMVVVASTSLQTVVGSGVVDIVVESMKGTVAIRSTSTVAISTAVVMYVIGSSGGAAPEPQIGCSYVKSRGRRAFGKDSVTFLESPPWMWRRGEEGRELMQCF